jgi:tetratricopeptide (TPR) repeat protein
MWKKALCCWAVVGAASLINPLAQPTAAALQSSSGTNQQVERALLEAAKQHPGDFAAQQNVGEFYLHQDRWPEGILYLQKAQQINPEDYNTGYDLSLAYLNSGDTANASTLLRKMIAQRETAELDNLLAEVNEKSGDLKTAALEYHRAAELDPSENNIFDLASFLLQHSNYEGFLDKSLTFFQYGVQKYPQSAKMTVGLGVALYAEGRYDDAVQTLCAAVDLDPTDPKPFQFLGKVSTISPARIPEIRSRLEKFVELYPNNGPAIYYYAMAAFGGRVRSGSAHGGGFAEASDRGSSRLLRGPLRTRHSVSGPAKISGGNPGAEPGSYPSPRLQSRALSSVSPLQPHRSEAACREAFRHP